MNRQAFFTISIVFLLFAVAADARTGGVSGKILDGSGKAAGFVNVILLNAADSGMVKTELTDDNGMYAIAPVPDGQYIIKAMLIGYKTYVSQKLSVSGKNVIIPDIVLLQTTTNLKEVAITAQKPFIEVHPDKLVVNVESSIVSAGSSVMDVLQRSPGVTVDQDDNISLKGKQGVNIMIDGRIVPVSATDLANMLKSMPAGSVDKIEIISNPSAKYDAAGTAGIINIKTKKDNKVGLNGSVNAGYGQGVYPKKNGGFSLNYRQKKLNVYANLNASFREGFSETDWVRSFYDSSRNYTGAYIQHTYTAVNFNSNTAAIGADYDFTSKTSAGLSLNGENLYLGSKGYYFANVLGPDHTIQSYFATNNTSSGNWYNYAPNVHFKHDFDTTGKELTVDADYGRYWNKNGQDFTTDYYNLNGTLSAAPYILHANVSGITQIQSLKADYVNPLKNGARIEAGIKTSYVVEDNEPKFYDRSTGTDEYDSTKSDHFIYNENINAAYINASKEWKKWGVQLGLRAEQTIVNGTEKITGQSFDTSYIQLFPSLAVQSHVNANNDIDLTLSRRIERPGYDELNPYKFFVDPTTYREGNPYLYPALTYSMELSHVYKQRLITTVSYSRTTNVITEVILPSSTQDRVTIQTQKNLHLMSYYGIGGSYSIPIYKWWTMITNINTYYSNYQGDLANTQLNAGKPAINVYTDNKFTLPKEWTAELSIFYQSAQEYGFLNLTPISMVSPGIQKNLLDKRLTIRLNATDIFWHGNESGSSTFTGYTVSFIAKHDTRQANLTVTYRFGKKTVAPVQRHTGGDEDEMKRAGGGGQAG